MKNAFAVILNFNNFEKTSRIASSICSYNLFEKIIVVDNCSTDDSFSKLSKISNNTITTIKSEKNGGFAYGNNYGINYIFNNFHNAEYIGIFGSDIIIGKDSLEKCFDTYIMYLTRRKGKYKKYVYNDYNNPYLETDCIRGSFMFFRAKALKESGLFDENTFLFYEENIMCKKIKKLNYKVVIVNDASYIHDHVLIDTANYIKYKSSLNSAYYYLTNYVGINILQRWMYRFISFFGKIEYRLFAKFKKRN